MASVMIISLDVQRLNCTYEIRVTVESCQKVCSCRYSSVEIHSTHIRDLRHHIHNTPKQLRILLPRIHTSPILLIPHPDSSRRKRLERQPDDHPPSPMAHRHPRVRRPDESSDLRGVEGVEGLERRCRGAAEEGCEFGGRVWLGERAV